MEELKDNEEIIKDKYIRLLAEFENYKKRTAREKEDIIQQTKIEMISSILEMDNDISIAIKQVGDQPGMNLILSKLDKFLRSQGVEAIPCDEYNPDVHEVISNLDTGSSKIIDVASKGYTMNGKIFRHPKVILG